MREIFGENGGINMWQNILKAKKPKGFYGEEFPEHKKSTIRFEEILQQVYANGPRYSKAVALYNTNPKKGIYFAISDLGDSKWPRVGAFQERGSKQAIEELRELLETL
jgi:hypothetical protein